MLPFHPAPEEYDSQVGARQVERHDPFHRYLSRGDVGAACEADLARGLDQSWKVMCQSQDTQAEDHCLRLREFKVTAKTGSWERKQRLSRVGE